MTPHLVKWHNQYAAQGLTVLEIDNGQMDSVAAVRDHVQTAKIPFAILHDSSGLVCWTYGVQIYPSACLIDRDGKVIWEGVPSGCQADLERKIVQALAVGNMALR